MHLLIVSMEFHISITNIPDQHIQLLIPNGKYA